VNAVASLKRVGAIARTTVRDLGTGCTGVLAALALIYLLFAPGAPAASSFEEAWRIQLLERLERFVAIAAVGCAVATAWSVDRDRRTGRRAWWRATPLREPEYAAGKWLGATAVCSVACAVGGTAVLLLGAEGWRGGGELLRPPQRALASELLVQPRGGELAERPLETVLLDDVAARAILVFDEVPESESLRLRVDLGTANYERRADPHAPGLRVVDGDGRVLAEHSIEDLRVVSELAIGADWTSPLRVVVKPGSFRAIVGFQPAGLLIDPERLVLLGDDTPLWRGVVRFESGLLAWCALCCGLAAALAAALADVLAVAGTLLMLVLAWSRDFLVEVVQSIARPESAASSAARRCARALDVPLQSLPDVESWLRLRPLAESRSWSGDEMIDMTVEVVTWVLVAGVVASLAPRTWGAEA